MAVVAIAETAEIAETAGNAPTVLPQFTSFYASGRLRVLPKREFPPKVLRFALGVPRFLLLSFSKLTLIFTGR